MYLLVGQVVSHLQEPGQKKFKLFKIDLIYRDKKFKVLPLAI